MRSGTFLLIERDFGINEVFGSRKNHTFFTPFFGEKIAKSRKNVISTGKKSIVFIGWYTGRQEILEWTKQVVYHCQVQLCLISVALSLYLFLCLYRDPHTSSRVGLYA